MYKSQQPNLNKLEPRSPGDSLIQIQMISGQWFYRFFKELAKNCTKLPIIPLKIMVALDFNKLGRGSPEEHLHKI